MVEFVISTASFVDYECRVLKDLVAILLLDNVRACRRCVEDE